MTKHCEIRAQQRGIPPFIEMLLDVYGARQYDGHGGLIRFHDKNSRRKIEKTLGRALVSKLSQWRDVYKVESVDSGDTITIGHRTERIKRK